MNKWYFSGKIVLHISCQTKRTADDYQIDWSNILASHVYLLNAIYTNYLSRTQNVESLVSHRI